MKQEDSETLEYYFFKYENDIFLGRSDLKNLLHPTAEQSIITWNSFFSFSAMLRGNVQEDL